MSLESIHDAIRSRFNSQVATPQSLTVVYDNGPDGHPDDTLWARWTIHGGDNAQREVGGSTNTYRRIGVAIAELYAPPNDGDEGVLQLADVIEAAFRSVTASPVRFQTPRTRIVGQQDNWFRVNVVCPWYADELA